MLLLPSFLGEGFHDGLFIGVRGVPAGLPPWQAGLLVHFLSNCHINAMVVNDIFFYHFLLLAVALTFI